MIGGSGDDTIHAGDGMNWVESQWGNDDIRSGSGVDSVWAGAGIDERDDDVFAVVGYVDTVGAGSVIAWAAVDDVSCAVVGDDHVPGPVPAKTRSRPGPAKISQRAPPVRMTYPSLTHTRKTTQFSFTIQCSVSRTPNALPPATGNSGLRG